MTALQAPQSFGYEQTLMYGRYARDLLEETQRELEKLKREREKAAQKEEETGMVLGRE